MKKIKYTLFMLLIGFSINAQEDFPDDTPDIPVASIDRNVTIMLFMAIILGCYLLFSIANRTKFEKKY